MTRRRNLEQHRESLMEIRDILNSMKTLAFMETRKLARFLDAQHAVVKNIGDAATDLLGFFPESLPQAANTASVYLVIGAQRGFCGEFNHALLNQLESATRKNPVTGTVLIAIGHRLYTLLEGDMRVAACIDSASVAEEVPPVLSRVVDELSRLQEQNQILNLYGLYHGDEGGIVMQKILPPFQGYQQRAPQFTNPPVLNEAPTEFLLSLTDHYIFATLNEMLYTSLMAENQQRLTHLESAVNHLDDKSAEMTRQCNALRQEEIIEEIEVILLNTDSIENKRNPAWKPLNMSG